MLDLFCRPFDWKADPFTIYLLIPIVLDGLDLSAGCSFSVVHVMILVLNLVDMPE